MQKKRERKKQQEEKEQNELDSQNKPISAIATAESISICATSATSTYKATSC